MTLTQSQSENLVQLLLIATLTDHATTALEDDALTKHLESLPWTSGIGLTGFVNSAYASIRSLKPEARVQRASELCAVFDTTESRFKALSEIESLLEVDGVKASEDQLLLAIRKALT